MRCDICQSETPPHYQESLAAWICHTCKALGRFVQGLVIESKPPVPEENTEQSTLAQGAETDVVPTQDTTPTIPTKKKTQKL